MSTSEQRPVRRIVKPSQDDLQARIATLEAELKAAKAAKQSMVHFKVSEKGAVSVYGLGRFPVTLYADQWRALLPHAIELEDFLVANEKFLAQK